jgi:hypothetical protein
MKKAFFILLSLALTLPLAACGGDGNKTPSESSASAESEDTSSSEAETDEIKYYVIGQTAESNGLSITIDGAEPFDYTNMQSRPKDGFEYIKVWFTFKNISDETIETPRGTDIYIVYTEVTTGGATDKTSDDTSLVLLDVADRKKRHLGRVDLAPGESSSGWMVYQKQVGKSEVIIHYYPGYGNVPPDARFKFTLDSSAEGAPPVQPPAPESAKGTENETVVNYTGFSINEITGTYNVEGMGKSFQIELFKENEMLVLRFDNGTETEYEYDLVFGVASRYAEFDDGHTVLTILTFTRDGDKMRLTVDESLNYSDGSTKTGKYEGYKVQ